MPLNEALLLLFADSTFATLIVPVHHAYIFKVMLVFSDLYPVYAASAIVTVGALVGMGGNWSIGKLATAIKNTPFEQEAEKLNERLKKPQTVLEKIQYYWISYGAWSLLFVTLVPFLGQALAILAGWSGIAFRKMLTPTLIGALIHSLLMTAL